MQSTGLSPESCDCNLAPRDHTSSICANERSKSALSMKAYRRRLEPLCGLVAEPQFFARLESFLSLNIHFSEALLCTDKDLNNRKGRTPPDDVIGLENSTKRNISSCRMTQTLGDSRPLRIRVRTTSPIVRFISGRRKRFRQLRCHGGIPQLNVTPSETRLTRDTPGENFDRLEMSDDSSTRLHVREHWRQCFRLSICSRAGFL